MLYWFAGGLVLLVLSRAIVYSILNYLRQKGVNCKRVIIIGYGQIGREMHRRASCQNWYGYEVKAVQADAAQAQLLADPSIARIGALADIPRFAAAHRIDEIWITLPMSAASQLRE